MITYIEITNKCNKKCKHCFNGNNNNSFLEEMSTKQVFSLIDELKENGVSLVKIVGGEPALREDLEIVLLYLDKKRIPYIIFTDSIRIIDKIEALKTLSFLSEVRISIDGNRGVHDNIRIIGDFDSMYKTAVCLKENRIPVKINYTINKSNFVHVEEVFQQFEKVGIEMSFGIVKKCRNAEINNDILFDEQGILLFRSWLKELKTRNKALFDVLVNNIEDREEFVEQYVNECKYIGCYAGQESCFIDCIGNVWPCGMVKDFPQFMYGNAFDKNFGTIWNDMKCTWSHIAPEFACNQCNYHGKCTGGCRANGLYMSGKIGGKDPDCFLYCNNLEKWICKEE